MTIQEIARLKKADTLVYWAFKKDKRAVWQLLRTSVECQKDGTCGRCGAHDEALFSSPYNAPTPGWCIFCVLCGYFNHMPKLDEEFQIPGFLRGFPFYVEAFAGVDLG